MKLEKIFEEALEEAIRETFGDLKEDTREEMRFLAFIAGFLKNAGEIFEGTFAGSGKSWTSYEGQN